MRPVKGSVHDFLRKATAIVLTALMVVSDTQIPFLRIMSQSTGLLETPEALAEQLRYVQRGTLSFLKADVTTEEQADLPVTSDTNKRFGFAAGQANTATFEDALYGHSPLFSGSDAFIVKGSGKGGKADGEAAWQSVEYGSGVTAQTGGSTLGNNVTTKTVVLPTPVDKTKSFVMIQNYAPNAGTSSHHVIRATLQTDVGGNWTELLLERGAAGTTKSSATVEWQVVTMDTATVQQWSYDMPNAESSKTWTSPTTFNQVTSGETFVLSTVKTAETALDRCYAHRVTLDSNTSVTATRGTGTNTCSMTIQLISVPGITVQRNNNFT